MKKLALGLAVLLSLTLVSCSDDEEDKNFAPGAKKEANNDPGADGDTSGSGGGGGYSGPEPDLDDSVRMNNEAIEPLVDINSSLAEILEAAFIVGTPSARPEGSDFSIAIEQITGSASEAKRYTSGESTFGKGERVKMLAAALADCETKKFAEVPGTAESFQLVIKGENCPIKLDLWSTLINEEAEQINQSTDLQYSVKKGDLSFLELTDLRSVSIEVAKNWKVSGIRNDRFAAYVKGEFKSHKHGDITVRAEASGSRILGGEMKISVQHNDEDFLAATQRIALSRRGKLAGETYRIDEAKVSKGLFTEVFSELFIFDTELFK